MVGILIYVNKELAYKLGKGLGIEPEKPGKPLNHSIPADGNPKDYEPEIKDPPVRISKALSMADTIKSAVSRKVAILAADGVNEKRLNSLMTSLKNEGSIPVIVGIHLGKIKTKNGKYISADESLLTTSPALFDAVFIPDGNNTDLRNKSKANEFVKKAYEHYKPIGADGTGKDLLNSACSITPEAHSAEELFEDGICIDKSPEKFISLVRQHRFWNRNGKL
jgi:catalase